MAEVNNFLKNIQSSQSSLVITSDKEVSNLIKIIAENLKVGKDDYLEFSQEDGVEKLREQIINFHLRPNSSRRRLFVITGADLLNNIQANTILKILEEPPSYGKIVLFAKNKSKVLKTIISRCNQVYYASNKIHDRESVFPLIKLDFRSFLQKIESFDKNQVLNLLNGGLEELKKRGLNGNEQMYREIGRSIVLLESGSCNHRLILERLFVLYRSLKR